MLYYYCYCHKFINIYFDFLTLLFFILILYYLRGMVQVLLHLKIVINIIFFKHVLFSMIVYKHDFFSD